MTLGKQEVLWKKLVELKETPEKDGEAPGYRGEPTVWTEPLPRSWDIQGNEIIVPEYLDVFDGCFLRKFC